MTGLKLNKACAVALGNFDGLHIGHRKVLESTLDFSKKHNLEAKIMLFDIHPREFIFGEKIPRLLTDEMTEKAVEEMGFTVCRVKFSDIRGLSCEDFFEKVLADKLNARAVFCGFNYSFGRFGAGNTDTLKKLCEEHGVKCGISDNVTVGENTVSSTAIRGYLLNGEPEKAAEMLGRNYAVCGVVIHGDARGRTLGFPTVNQKIDETLAVPRYGVYESRINIDGKIYKGVTNIGIRPTYRSERVLAETYIIGFSGDIYGRELNVELVRYIRPERRFESAEELQAQLIKDTAEVTGNV